jgi:hypothetical protein
MPTGPASGRPDDKLRIEPENHNTDVTEMLLVLWQSVSAIYDLPAARFSTGMLPGRSIGSWYAPDHT